MHVHLVFVAKYRRRVFDGDAIDRLRIIFTKTCADFEAQLIEMDGEDDHVHLLVEYPPKVAVSNLVNSLKGVSGRLLRKERPDVQKHYWKGVLWSPSCFASSCGGAPISIVRQYMGHAPTRRGLSTPTRRGQQFSMWQQPRVSGGLAYACKHPTPGISALRHPHSDAVTGCSWLSHHCALAPSLHIENCCGGGCPRPTMSSSSRHHTKPKDGNKVRATTAGSPCGTLPRPDRPFGLQ